MRKVTITIRRNSFFRYAFLLLMVFLIGFNFMGQGSKLQIILLGYALLNMPRNLKMSSLELFLFLYVAACAIGRIINGAGLSVTYISTNLVSPVLMFSVGKMMASKAKNSIQVRSAMLAVFLGFVVQSIIVLIRSMVLGQASRMNIASMWGGQYTAIQQVMYATAVASLGMYYIVYEERMGKSVMGILAFIMSIVNSLYFASRSGIYVILVIFAIFLVHNVFLKWNPAGIKRLTMIAVGVSVALGIIQLIGLLNLKAIWQSTNLYERLFVSRAGLDVEGRLELWSVGLGYLLLYPLGYDYKYAHNMWIDLGLECGIFAMLMLVAYTIVSVRDIIRLQKITNADVNIQCIAMCLTTGHLVAFAVEPALQGVPMLVSMFFALNGIVRGYLVKLAC